MLQQLILHVQTNLTMILYKSFDFFSLSLIGPKKQSILKSKGYSEEYSNTTLVK